MPEAKIAGQFDAPGGDDWGVVLDKDSALTACVDQAIGELQSSASSRRSRTSGWAARPARPNCNRRRAPAGPAERRIEREAARRRRTRRQAAIATLSTVVVIGLLVTAIVTSKGWPTVHEAFFSPQDFMDSFPAVAKGSGST